MPAKVHEHLRARLVALSRETLWSSEGEDSLTYLREKRRLNDDEIQLMSFGCCPQRAKRYLDEAGLPDISGRIIMPFYDAYGELLVVTTRDIRGECPNGMSKHWHESFIKAEHLFGLHWAKDAIIEKKAAVVVEGQFDVAYLRSIGIKNVVGMLGSCASYRQLSLLVRYCSTIYLFFDGDKAGRDATRKTMEIGYKHRLSDPIHGIKLIPILTPQGKDPDEFSLSEVIDLCRQAKKLYKKNEDA